MNKDVLSLKPQLSLYPSDSGCNDLRAICAKCISSLVFITVCLGASGASGAGQPPPNDNYANATVLSGEDVVISGITSHATLETGPGGAKEILGPDSGYRYGCDDSYDPHSVKSLWWRWRAPHAGVAFVLQPRYLHPGEYCSPVLTVWRTQELGASFPFQRAPQPVCILASGLNSARYLYLPFAAKEGEEFVFQMLGNSPQTHSVRLLMHSGPLILEEPVEQAVQKGEAVFLHVVAAGAQKPSFPSSASLQPGCQYQWWFNDHPLDGETYSFLRIPKMSQDLVGSYRVVVTDERGTNRSRAAKVSIRAQAESPQLEVRLTQSQNPVEFSLRGEPGRIYQLEGSINLMDWSSVQIQPLSGLEPEDRFVSGAKAEVRDKIALNGSPFRFGLVSPAGASFVRVRKWESSCDECMSQLWALQFAKEAWAREELRTDTDFVSEVDIFPRHAAPHLIYPVAPNDARCGQAPLVLGWLGGVPRWPCPWWPAADGTLVPFDELPGGVWNGARIPNE